NKRLRGLRILKEVIKTGNFKWRFKIDNEEIVTNLFTESIDRYIGTRDLSPRNIDFEKKTLVKFSTFLIENGVYRYQDITYDHIVSFINLVSLRSSGFLNRIRK